MPSIKEKIVQRWQDAPIATKLLFSSLLIVLLLVGSAATGYLSRMYQQRAYRSITASYEIQRLVLEMDNGMQRAHRLHSEFFLYYPRIGFINAHEQYAQASIRQAAKVVALSRHFKEELSSLPPESAFHNLHVDLNLYLSSAKRFADTSIASFELVSRLVAPDDGLEAQLNAVLDKLAAIAEPYAKYRPLVVRMHSMIQKYRINRKRPDMQRALNTAREMQDTGRGDSSLNDKTRRAMHDATSKFSTLARQITDIDGQISSLFNDFRLQGENIRPISKILTDIAAQEVNRSQKEITRAKQMAKVVILASIFFGIAVLICIVWLLHRSISGRIERMTETAKKIRQGRLDAHFNEDSADELGLLASVFNTMTGQLAKHIGELQLTKTSLELARDTLENEVKERTSDLEKLLAFSKTLTGTRNLKNLYRKCTSLARELLGLDYSTIMLFSDDRTTLVLQASIGFPESAIGTLALLDGQGLSPHVARTGKPAVVVDHATETRFQVPPIVFAEHITSGLGVPMMINEEIVGVFIGHTRARREFTETEISLYQSFANQAAIAIDNVRHSRDILLSEKKFRTFFDNANDAILILTTAGQFLEVNQVTCDSLGYSHAELLRMSVNDIVDPRLAIATQERIHRITESAKEIFETAHRHRDGHIIPVEMSCTLIEFQAQPAILVVSRDITERQKMEQEIIRAKKLDSVGVLAGGIAHDFNNILAAILGNINLSRLDDNMADETKQLLEEAEKASLRAKHLTQQLLTFAKGGEPVRETASIAEVIKDSADFVLRGSSVSCTSNFADDLWLVKIDRGQMSQVIQNLIINARQAMPEGGSITVDCANISNPKVLKDLGRGDGKFVQITIQDSGTGIPEKIIEKIFDPYFSTKQDGNGLGLAITHSIVTKHDGYIFAHSNPEQGTTFTIYLPATEDTKPAVRHASQTADTPVRGGRIMIMDDEEMVRKVGTAMLKRLGYEIIPSNDGAEAIDLYKKAMRAGKGIDAVIMDLTIPGGMGGQEAMGKILAIDANARGIVSSGYSNDPVMADCRKYGFKTALVKPFQLQELAETLQGVLQ